LTSSFAVSELTCICGIAAVKAGLDEAFEGIATARANAEKNLQNARALFSQELQLVMAALLGSYPSLKMEEICEIGDGNHSSNYPKKDELVESGVPFIRAQNIVEGSIIGVDMRFLSPEKHAKLKKGHLRAGDVLFTNRGDIGNTAIVSEEYDDSNLNSQIAWFRCTPSMENRFLMYFLNSPAMRELYSSTKSGAALQQFTIKMIKSLQIVCPPRAIQTSTSNRLDSLFTRCRSLEGILNEKLMALDELKQSLLHQAFTGKL
jgi:type I restriction enzyme S subunit